MESLEEKALARTDGICVRIDGLKEILNARVKVGEHQEIVPGVYDSGDGHSFNDSPATVRIDDYKPKYSDEERKQARKELKKLRKNSNPDIRVYAYRALYGKTTMERVRDGIKDRFEDCVGDFKKRFKKDPVEACSGMLIAGGIVVYCLGYWLY